MRESAGSGAGRQVVLAPNWIGDAAMAAPFFASLRAAFPGERIEALAPPWCAPLLDAYPWLDSVHPAEGGKWVNFLSARRNARGEGGEGIGTLWILPNSFRSALLGRWLGAARRVGYAAGGRGWLLTHAVRSPETSPPPAPPESPPPHLIDYYLGLLEAEGIRPVHRTARLPVRPEALDFADRLIASEISGGGISAGDGPGRDAPLVGFHPGAFYGGSKTWAVESYGALARRLADSAGARVLVLGGPAEVELAERVCAAAEGAAVSLAGKDTLASLPGLLARLSVLVAGDTGPLHVAALVGVPTLSLFGPTDPDRTAPRGEAHRLLRREMECAPCFERVCPLGHHRCMTDIGPEEVADEVENILAGDHTPRQAGAGAAN